jgi:hypothetical protein
MVPQIRYSHHNIGSDGWSARLIGCVAVSLPVFEVP